MSKINYQALREAAAAVETVATHQKLVAFRVKVTPQVVLAILDELDKKQQYIKLRRTRKLRLRLGSCVLSWKLQNQNSTSSVSITKALSRMEVSASPNWKQSNPLRKNWFAVKAAITVSRTIVRWQHCLA